MVIIESPKRTVVEALVLVFKMIDLGGCESVSFGFNCSSNSLSHHDGLENQIADYSLMVSSF